MQAILGCQKEEGGMVPGVSCVGRGNWGSECDSSSLFHVPALYKQHNSQNAVF